MMPSAYRGKRRIPNPKRQKSKSKRSRPIKKKKPHLKCGGQKKQKPVAKAGKIIRRKPSYPPLNSSKTLQQLRQDNMYMTTKARGIMISFVKHLYKWVSIEAERLRKERNRPSIGFIEMRTALKSVMPGKCKKCVESSSKGRGSRHVKAS